MNAPLSLDSFADEACAWCGKEYMPRTYNHKYCCEACRYASLAAFDKQWRRDMMDRLKCLRCGTAIENAKKRSTKYCCIPCRSAAARDRRFGRVADLRCVDCSNPIPEAGRRDTKLCMLCARERHRKANRERARLQRQLSAAARVRPSCRS